MQWFPVSMHSSLVRWFPGWAESRSRPLALIRSFSHAWVLPSPLLWCQRACMWWAACRKKVEVQGEALLQVKWRQRQPVYNSKFAGVRLSKHCSATARGDFLSHIFALFIYGNALAQTAVLSSVSCILVRQGTCTRIFISSRWWKSVQEFTCICLLFREAKW